MFDFLAHAMSPHPHLKLVADAVLCGNSPAMIWADDPCDPRAALMWDKAHCFYLLGASEHAEFNRTLGQHFAETIAPDMHTRKLGVFKVDCTNDAWREHINLIFPGITFRPLSRTFFALAQPRVRDWAERVPSDFAMCRITRELLNGHLQNTHALIGEIESCWNSRDDFCERGFGFCLTNVDAIAGWCTAEYVSANQCGIGIETIEAFQNRGFATLMASAFVEYCAAHRIAPHWDAAQSNTPSLAVARKVGLTKILDYDVSLGWLK